MDFDESSLGPIERLKWEHVRLLDEIDALAIAARRPDIFPGGLPTRVAAALEFLERHQEAEERFLLPLIPQLDGGAFKIIYEEHLGFLHLSDLLLAAGQSEDPVLLSDYLNRFRSDLKSHFSREEAAVFKKSSDILSPAQKDILRIKFASRKGKEI